MPHEILLGVVKHHYWFNSEGVSRLHVMRNVIIFITETNEKNLLILLEEITCWDNHRRHMEQFSNSMSIEQITYGIAIVINIISEISSVKSRSTKNLLNRFPDIFKRHARFTGFDSFIHSSLSDFNL